MKIVDDKLVKRTDRAEKTSQHNYILISELFIDLMLLFSHDINIFFILS